MAVAASGSKSSSSTADGDADAGPDNSDTNTNDPNTGAVSTAARQRQPPRPSQKSANEISSYIYLQFCDKVPHMVGIVQLKKLTTTCSTQAITLCVMRTIAVPCSMCNGITEHSLSAEEANAYLAMCYKRST
jgi:hypothetical protein